MSQGYWTDPATGDQWWSDNVENHSAAFGQSGDFGSSDLTGGVYTNKEGYRQDISAQQQAQNRESISGQSSSESYPNLSNVVNNNVQNPTYNSQPSYSATNNTAAINSGYDSILQSTLQSIRAAVQQAKGKVQQKITKAPEEYGRLKNIVYNQSLSGLPGIRENTANMGASSTGGMSRSERTRADSDLQGKLNNLNIEQQNYINEANATIADLEAKGQFDEANATRENAQSKLQAIIAESNRLDALSQQERTRQDNLAQQNRQFGLQERQLTNQENQQKFNQEQTAKAETNQIRDKQLREFESTVTQYENQEGGYQAKINELQTSSDPLKIEKIGILNKVRNAKIQKLLTGETDNIDSGVYDSVLDSKIEEIQNDGQAWNDDLISRLKARAANNAAADKKASDASATKAEQEQYEREKTNRELGIKERGLSLEEQKMNEPKQTRLTYKDYFNEAKAKLTATQPRISVDSDGKEKVVGTIRKYTDEEVMNYVLRLPLSNEEIAELLSDLGL